MSISHRTHRLRLDGSPSVDQLHNGRYRLTFKLKSTNPSEDWYNSNKDSIFAEYGSLQSDAFDGNGAEARVGEAYSDMLLVSASSKGEGEDYSITFVYETLTSAFVVESENKIDFDLNGLKRVVKTIIAKSGTAYSNALGTTPLSSDSESSDNEVILAKSEDYQLKSEEGGFRRITETYLEKGIISVDVKTKYGGNAETSANDFQIAEIKAVGLTASEALAASLLSGFAAFDTAEENSQGLSIFVYRYTKGSGEISRTTSTEGLITNVVITSVNEKPDSTGIGVITKTDVQAREDALIYTYTFSSGSGTLETKTSSKYNNQLTITTVRSLDTVPSVPSGAYQVSASSESSGAFLIHTLTYAAGSGQIGISEESRYDDKLTITTKTHLNEVPTMSAATISTDVRSGDYGQIYVYKFASGSGRIGISTDSRYGGTLTITTLTHLNEVPSMTSAATISTDVKSGDYGDIYTYKFASGSGQIGISTDQKYNNKLTITTKTFLNEVPSMSATTIGTEVRSGDYGDIYTYKFASGAGRIGENESKKYDDVITVTTVKHLNEAAETSGTIISTDEQETEFGTIFSATFYTGEGQIQEDIQNRYDDNLTITTVANINSEPTVPAGAYLMKSSVRDTEYGPITSKTFAEGEGKIEDSDRSKVISISSGLDGEVQEIRERHLNPPSVPDKGTEYVLVSERNTDGDFGQISEYTWIKGSGILRKSKEIRSDGSEVHTFACAGAFDVETDGGMTGAAGEDYFLVSEDVQAQEGYEITTYKYYTLPDNYEVTYVKSLRTADRIDFDSDLGPHIGEAGSMDSFTGTSSVSFSIDLPENAAVSDLEPSVVIGESVRWTDGTLTDRNMVFRNAYADFGGQAETGGGTEIYRGKAYKGYNVNVTGDTVNPYTGTLTVGFEVLPYISVGGVTVYKTTKSEVTVAS